MDKSLDQPRRAGGTATPAWLAGVAGAGLLTLMAGNAGAQATPAPATAPDPEVDPALTSVEQGQTPLDVSFESEEDRRDRIREQRRQAFADTDVRRTGSLVPARSRQVR